MLWLIWQMWIFLFIAFGLGLGLGWRLWSASGETGKALQSAQDEIERLQRENDQLTRTVARQRADQEAASRPKAAAKSGQTSSAATPAAKSTGSKPATKKPAKTKAAKPASSAPAKPDDLTAIKGIGPKAAEALNAKGVTTYAQIAAWTDNDIKAWDERLNGRGRIVRDDWVGQAKAKAG